MKKTLCTCFAISAVGCAILLAQPAEPPSQDFPHPQQGEFRHPPHRPPLPPLMVAMDTNRDGMLDPDEIADASAAMMQLDKDGDGYLTREELRPPFPPHHRPSHHFEAGPGNGPCLE